MDDDTPTGRWMTYDEIAATRGIKRSGAVRLVQRQKWRRQAGNDGYARIWVPHDEQAKVRGTKLTPERPYDGGDDSARDGGGTMAAVFAAALGALREAHGREAAAWQSEREALQASHAGEVRALRAELTAAADRAERTNAEAQEAHQQAEALRARERAWWGQSRLRRILAAWRGE